jgi:hypothetical protein
MRIVHLSAFGPDLPRALLLARLCFGIRLVTRLALFGRREAGYEVGGCSDYTTDYTADRVGESRPHDRFATIARTISTSRTYTSTQICLGPSSIQTVNGSGSEKLAV